MDLILNEIIENVTTSTISPSDDGKPSSTIGYISVLISVLFFGSNFVPAAKYSIGDGVSFQFFLCCGIWTTGLVIHLILGSPTFYPTVLIGGALWTTGNCLSMFVIPINGLGFSMLLWCTSNLFMGWASGHFGWFGLTAEAVDYPILNYIGVATAVCSGFIFLAIKTGQVQSEENESQSIINSNQSNEKLDNDQSNGRVTMQKRIIGCILAVISGIFFGLVFTPSTYIQDHPQHFPNVKQNGLYYVFSMFSGIFLSSFFYFTIYIIYKKNRPYIVIESILPAFISGIMWAIAQAAFILANSALSQAISFPLISIGPATIATLWSIFYIKDIRGKRNYLIFSIGTLVRITAGVLIVLSKIKL